MEKAPPNPLRGCEGPMQGTGRPRERGGAQKEGTMKEKKGDEYDGGKQMHSGRRL
jgi:hypothetical protein